jgi:hypothetical protein
VKAPSNVLAVRVGHPCGAPARRSARRALMIRAINPLMALTTNAHLASTLPPMRQSGRTVLMRAINPLDGADDEGTPGVRDARCGRAGKPPSRAINPLDGAKDDRAPGVRIAPDAAERANRPHD